MQDYKLHWAGILNLAQLRNCPPPSSPPSLFLLLIFIVTDSFELVSWKWKKEINSINQRYYSFAIEIVLRPRSVDKYPERGNSNTGDKQTGFLCLLCCDRLR